jgi:hypothetical protein
MAIGSYYKTIQKQSNMKPFDLEKVKQGHPVQTRDGRDVRIIKTNANNRLPVIGICNMHCGDSYEEEANHWFEDGSFTRFTADDNDLFMKPTNKEGWINIYVREDGIRRGKSIYNSKEKAQQHNFGGIDTVKIEWEE